LRCRTLDGIEAQNVIVPLAKFRGISLGNVLGVHDTISVENKNIRWFFGTYNRYLPFQGKRRYTLFNQISAENR
jgi:hypothetical protein